MYRQHKRMRVGTFLTPERNTAAHNAHSPRTVRRRRCSAVPVATQGQLPAPLAVGPDHQIGNLEGSRKTAFCLKLRTLKTIKGLQKLQNLYSDPPSSATRNNCGSPELPREINPFCTARLLDCQKLLRIQYISACNTVNCCSKCHAHPLTKRQQLELKMVHAEI